MQIDSITILGGTDKNSNPEPVKEVEILKGEIVSLVGPTGSGKSCLMSDLDKVAQRDTITKREILICGQKPTEGVKSKIKKMVGFISQNMQFFCNLNVSDFLKLHAESRELSFDEGLLNRVLYLANQITGEPINPILNLTVLSGGQTRALMIADIAVISDTPVLLIDELENAGILRDKALEILLEEGKIVLIATHDPVLALMAQRRIVFKNGAMIKVIESSNKERVVAKRIARIDHSLEKLRNCVRGGEIVESLEGYEL
jgi:ABC-type lipoprotein export system ATPase subunit